MMIRNATTEYEAARVKEKTSLWGLEELMYQYFNWYFPSEVAQLREMGVFGRSAVEADDGPWDNIGMHCFLVAIICLALARLLRLSPEDTRLLVSTALVHDDDKRENRVAIKAAKGTRAKNWLTFKFEAAKKGLGRVTSIDLRDFLSWTVLELILRLADSCAGQSDDKKEAIVDGLIRIGQLIVRDRTGAHGHKGHSAQVGRRFYQGRPFYEVLKMVTEHCQIVLWKMLRSKNPKLRSKKFGHEHMIEVIKAEITSILMEFDAEVVQIAATGENE